jgi:hypothetical protein
MPGNIVPGSIALAMLVSATSCAEAATGAQPSDAFAVPITGSSQIAQNSAGQCINGYRVTHRVASGGRLSQGVILKCKS